MPAAATDRYVVQGTESVVNYTPVTELDYGTLLCWATNDIGQQVHPCVFQIVAAGKTHLFLQVSTLFHYD